MRKAIILCLFVTTSVMAAPKTLRPCDSKQLSRLSDSITDAKKDGFKNVKLMKNSSKGVVGFFAWENKNDQSVVVEICEYLGSDDIVAASDWSYWDEDTAPNPAKWVKGKTYRATQDEGAIDFKVIKTSASGNITAEISPKGISDAEEDFVTVRKDIVTFQ